MTQCFRKDTKLNVVLLSNVQLQKQLEPTDKRASRHEARQQNSVRRHDGSNHQETQRGKLQTERMQISHEFPSASNHFTHCWADTQNSRRQKLAV